MRGKDQRRRRRLRVHLPVFLMLLGVLFCFAVVRLWGPVMTGRRQHRELLRLKAEKAALRAEHARLEDYRRRMASEEGLEAAARARGYVMPGDRLLKFVPDKGKAAPPPAKAAQPKSRPQ